MLRIFLLISSLSLIAAIFSLPYGYYTLMRLIVAGTAVYAATNSYKSDDKFNTVIMIIVALLFNPVIPIHLSREVWMPIDLITAVYMFIYSRKFN